MKKLNRMRRRRPPTWPTFYTCIHFYGAPRTKLEQWRRLHNPNLERIIALGRKYP